MIATIMVATIAALSAGFDGQYFTESQTSDYYLSPENPRGQWFGSAAVSLGLIGDVAPEAFKSVLAGIHFKTQKPLVPKLGPKRVPGVDICFSVPKSVSAFWAVADTQTRLKVEECTREAVEEVLRFVEERVKVVRRGHGGFATENGKILAALFAHATNRLGEPDLHYHAVVTNLALRSDGKFSHINTKALFDWTRTLGPLFRASLANRLRDVLGVNPIRLKDELGRDQSWFEIEGVPQELCKAWSTRRSQIEQRVNANGMEFGTASAKTRASANLSTRRSKSQLPSLAELYQKWNALADSHGFTSSRAAKLRGTVRDHDIPKLYDIAIQQSLAKLTDSEAHFSYRDLLRETAERLQHVGLSGSDLIRHVDATVQQSPTLVKLAGEGLDQRLTTQSMWKLEKEFIKNVESLRNREGAHVKPKKIQKVIRKRSNLSVEQADAVKELLTSNESIRVLHGIAGAGKSHTLDAVREAFTKSGFRVIGGAVSGVVKEELQLKTSIESRTVASYLWHLDKSLMSKVVTRLIHDMKQLARAATHKPTFKYDPIKFGKNTVLVLDEAGMLDTHSMNRLLHHAIKARTTVILVGDDSQLQSIKAGGAFHYLIKLLKSATLTQNWRQKDVADQEAVSDIREGRASKALENYKSRDRIVLGKTRGDAIEKLVQKWVKAGGIESPDQHAIFTETRLEAREINKLCQLERLAKLKISESKGINFHDAKFFVGERVLFHKADRTRGIENGYRGTIISVNRITRSMRVKLDGEKKGKIAIAQISLIGKSEDDLTHAWSTTTHKLQGATVEHSYVLLGGGMSDKNMAYTQLTRGKESTHLFTDEQSAGADLKDLARKISKDRTKTLAHEHKRDLEHDLSH